MAPPARTGIRESDYTISASGCWVWSLFIDKDGYGFVRAGGKAWRAHRFSWTVLVGPIPDGMEIDHLCFMPSCVNPDHLRVVTPLVNMRNHRAAHKTHCVHGHEFTPENTLWNRRGSGRTYRRCVTCRRKYDTARRVVAA